MWEPYAVKVQTIKTAIEVRSALRVVIPPALTSLHIYYMSYHRH